MATQTTNAAREETEEMPEAVAQLVADLRHQVKPYSDVSDAKGVLSLVKVWSAIAITCALAIWANHPIGYALAFISFASCQIALSVLMHDAAHLRLFKNAELNITASDLFLALPLLILTSRYQKDHPSHHAFPNHLTRDQHWATDWGVFPDFWQWPKTPMKVVSLFIRDMLFINVGENSLTFKRFCAFNPFQKITRAELLRLALFSAAVALMLMQVPQLRLLVVLWVACLPTLMFAMLRFRTIAEHVAVGGNSGWLAIRHVRAPLIERLLFAPFNINHHIAHHLFPRVPYYWLPQVQALIEAHPNFAAYDGCIKESYLGLRGGVLGELVEMNTGVRSDLATAAQKVR